MQRADIVIVGGGIIGLATAYQLSEDHPHKKVVILEKEATLACHQSGRNSGVLHSGIYYKPGTLKAINCREGKRAMEAFCQRHGIACEICGKVIVAVDASELRRLHLIYERGQANGVACELIDRSRLVHLEPATAGICAIHVPEAGIVDFVGVARKLGELVCQRGGEIHMETCVTAIRQQQDRVIVETTQGEFDAGYLVNCAGLYSDRVAAMSAGTTDVKIIPFRGEFFELVPAAVHLCRNLIYPVPDPSFPFLGVHFTRLALGGVECGPNAVLAFAREGYRKTDFNFTDLYESLTYPGFLKLTLKHWKMGLGEMWRSISKQAFVSALQKLVPAITAADLQPAPSGVRAQALNRDGTLVDDFVVDARERIVNVINAPSPAATAALNIGKMIVQRLAERF